MDTVCIYKRNQAKKKEFKVQSQMHLVLNQTFSANSESTKVTEAQNVIIHAVLMAMNRK